MNNNQRMLERLLLDGWTPDAMMKARVKDA
jgi:hypothetical protein